MLFAFTFGGTFFDVFSLMRSMMAAPIAADPAISHVVPLSDHGVIHYITPLQNTLFFYVLFPTVLVVLSVGLWIFLGEKIQALFCGDENLSP
jgi:hypothetical protein